MVVAQRSMRAVCALSRDPEGEPCRTAAGRPWAPPGRRGSRAWRRFTVSELEQAFGLLDACDGKVGGIEEAQLNEQRGLIPVDVFVGDLVTVDPHHDDRGNA